MMRATLLMLLAAGCASAPAARASGDDGDSLFNPHTYRSLVAEAKALRVGDVLTVMVQETATASSSADLHTQRGFSVSGQASTSKVGPYTAAANTGTQSDGSGVTDRSGQLVAQVTVRVLAINASGDLQVSGQQTLKINGEQQTITLNGIVRTRDIAPDNTVLSSRIGDARIEYAGKGFVATQSKPGWLARVFGWLGL
jgi:flagellar L-ring protein precursor FlgH